MSSALEAALARCYARSPERTRVLHRVGCDGQRWDAPKASPGRHRNDGAVVGAYSARPCACLSVGCLHPPLTPSRAAGGGLRRSKGELAHFERAARRHPDP